ncbi:MAG: replication associated protein [Arizlama virus AZLM_719]|nr:MAG: replication associated protein [Arizlama virus]
MTNGTDSRKLRYWMLTIPANDWTPPETLPRQMRFLRGQKECGDQGYVHWQVVVCFTQAQRMSAVKRNFTSTTHCEPSRSVAANDYVWKEDTRVEGSQFQLGLPIVRGGRDWDAIWNHAKEGNLMEIPADVRVRSYGTIKKIEKDFMKPSAMERKVFVLWGSTGTGKSHRAWQEAGLDAYPKDPNTKYWDGYQGQAEVVMDEFRGMISISNLLRWCDKYPVSVECKFGAVVFKATRIFITSNLHPREWYSDMDNTTWLALERRLNIIEITSQEQEISFE